MSLQSSLPEPKLQTANSRNLIALVLGGLRIGRLRRIQFDSLLKVYSKILNAFSLSMAAGQRLYFSLLKSTLFRGMDNCLYDHECKVTGREGWSIFLPSAKAQLLARLVRFHLEIGGNLITWRGKVRTIGPHFWPSSPFGFSSSHR